jgi:hypothetical protein
VPPGRVQSASHASATSRRARPRADWELASAFDDAPIGTVDFDATTGELPPEIEAALDEPVLNVDSGNARSRRAAQMQNWRDQADRRSLLHRVGLPEIDED